MMNRLEHLLTILSEECNETAQRSSKAIRFGLQEIQPEQSLSNAERLIYEFNDIIAIMETLQEEGYINHTFDRDKINKKKEKIEKYINYSKECGTLNKEEK